MPKQRYLPISEDISPDVASGLDYEPCSAGLTLEVCGDELVLYAVSLNAGVWASFFGLPWQQLQNSPPRACSIAIDPGNRLHIAVGERADEVADPADDRSGAWESLDAGQSWTKILDPQALGSPSQVVPSLAITPRGTVVMATEGGLFVKPQGQAAAPAQLPQDLAGRAVSAVVATASRVWARLPDYTLLSSTDDGATFTRATNQPLPDGVQAVSRGDDFSLAAFDWGAFMVTYGGDNGAGNNYTALLTYDVAEDAWIFQKQLVDDNGNATLNGTGLGGRRFVRAFGSGGSGDLSKGAELLVCQGQAVLRATGRNQDGTFTWMNAVTAGPAGGPPKDPLWKNMVHSDMWGFHLSPDLQLALVCGDGGVFFNSLDGNGWRRMSQGMHTHHAHTLTLLSPGKKARARLAYATSDNDAWTWDEVKGWQTPNVFGDANWTDGDAGNPAAALLARTLDVPWLTGFNAKLPTGDVYDRFVANNDSNLDDGSFIRPFLQFIQTPGGEMPDALLDAVMLVELPLSYTNAQGQRVAAPGPLGDGSTTGWVLIRNASFSTQPDVNVSQYQGWKIEVPQLPAGTKGFWVSGGHASPVYYAYSVGSSVTLHRWDGTQWNALDAGDLMVGAIYGPAHVSPYDPDIFYVLARTGVRVSVTGGQKMIDETHLTDLLTDSGRYPFSPWNAGFNGRFISAVGRGNALATLSHVGFNRYDSAAVVAASPFTGVFYNDRAIGNGHWRSLTGTLPSPLPPVSAVAIDEQAIYVATEGRSVLRILHYGAGPLQLPQAILNEIFQLMLFGVINDIGGVVLGPTGPEPVGPWGPIMRALPPAARDLVLGTIIERAASLLGDRAARREIGAIIDKLEASDFAHLKAALQLGRR